jgi:hypothetical protein
VGGVELGDSPGSLEDHGVALDESALVAEPSPAVPLAGDLLGGARRLLELEVDAVHELLLASDLTLGKLFGQRSFLSVPGILASPQAYPGTSCRRDVLTTVRGDRVVE